MSSSSEAKRHENVLQLDRFIVLPEIYEIYHPEEQICLGELGPMRHIQEQRLAFVYYLLFLF